MGLAISNMVLATGFALIVIGLWGILTHTELFRIIIGYMLFGTGSHLVIVAIGYVADGTAPIIDRDLSASQAPLSTVDPIPAALAVTAIVIGLAVTAVMLAYAVRIHESEKNILPNLPADTEC